MEDDATRPGKLADISAALSEREVARSAKEVEKTSREVEKSSRELEKSSKAVEEGTKEVVSDTYRQLQMAADRTLLAAERTFAAWVRTGLSSLAAGVGARALLQDVIPLWLAKLTGSVLVIFAGFCFVAAVWRDLWRPPPPATDVRPVPRQLLVPLSGFLLIVAVAALIGIWAA
jgi:putative membrane protein